MHVINDFVRCLRIEYGLSNNTAISYRRDVKKFFAFLKSRNIKFGQLKKSHVTEFFLELGKNGLSSRSIARITSSIRTFLKFLAREGSVESRLLDYLKTPRFAKKLPKILTEREVTEMLEVSQQKNFSKRDSAILELLYATGARVFEISNLRLKDINFQHGFISFWGKGDKQRIVPVGQIALKKVQDYIKNERSKLKYATSDYLFISRKGKRLSRETIWRIIKKVAYAAGVGHKVYPHTLRHSFASHIMQRGANIRYVQEILGHSSISTTQIYTHLDIKRLKEIHKRYHPRG